VADAGSLPKWYETFRVTGRKNARREQRHARAALKRLISAAEGDSKAVGLQLFGQAMSAAVYERFRPIANQNMRRRRIIQTLPDSLGQTVVVVWGLEAGSAVVPSLSTRDFPTLLGTTVAVRCAADAPDGPAFVSGVVSWIDINSHDAPTWVPAPPLLQRWHRDGSKATETVDFGLTYPLPALDLVAA
jgi:hypothetical protein